MRVRALKRGATSHSSTHLRFFLGSGGSSAANIASSNTFFRPFCGHKHTNTQAQWGGKANTHRSNQTGGGENNEGGKCNPQLIKQAGFSSHHSSETSVEGQSAAELWQLKSRRVKKEKVEGKEPNSALTSPTSFLLHSTCRPSGLNVCDTMWKNLFFAQKSMSLLSPRAASVTRLVTWPQTHERVPNPQRRELGKEEGTRREKPVCVLYSWIWQVIRELNGKTEHDGTFVAYSRKVCSNRLESWKPNQPCVTHSKYVLDQLYHKNKHALYMTLVFKASLWLCQTLP